MLVCILSDIKSAAIVSVYLSGDRYLGDGVANWRAILHDGRAVSQTYLSAFVSPL